MERTLKEIDEIPVHFILCTERTGSTLLCMMLNLSPQVLSTSEEPFAIFFYKKYKQKSIWSELELKNYVDEFWLMAEKSLGLYFTTKEKLLKSLLPHRNELTYERLIKITYLQFLEPKPKDQVQIIIDKQIKYFFYLPLLFEIFPKAKYVVLVRDVRDNVVSKSKRGLNSSSNALFLSALWNYTYSNVHYLEKQKKEFHVVRYEDMAMDTEATMKKVCAFYNIQYSNTMIQTEGLYDLFLKERGSFVEPVFLENLKDFHSGLFAKPNTKRIGIYKTELDTKTQSRIVSLNRVLFKRFGYAYSESEVRGLNLFDRWQILLAYLYRPLLLKVYFLIPFSVKLSIKKIRKRKVRV